MTHCLDCGSERMADQCPSCGLTSAAAELVVRRRLVRRTALFLVGIIVFVAASQVFPPLELDDILIFVKVTEGSISRRDGLRAVDDSHCSISVDFYDGLCKRGGMDSVAIIAASSKVDISFVMALQTARFVIVLLIGPRLARLIAGWTEAANVRTEKAQES